MVVTVLDTAGATTASVRLRLSPTMAMEVMVATVTAGATMVSVRPKPNLRPLLSPTTDTVDTEDTVEDGGNGGYGLGYSRGYYGKREAEAEPYYGYGGYRGGYRSYGGYHGGYYGKREAEAEPYYGYGGYGGYGGYRGGYGGYGGYRYGYGK